MLLRPKEALSSRSKASTYGRLARFAAMIGRLPMRAAEDGLARFKPGPGRSGSRSLPTMRGHFRQDSLGHIEGAAAMLAGDADAGLAADSGHEVALFFQQRVCFRYRQLFQRQVIGKQVVLEVSLRR